MSKLYEYATDELRRAGLYDPDADYGGHLGQAISSIIDVMSKQGHSGESMNTTLELLKRVAHYKPLTPLTGADDEWEDRSEYGSVLWQNKRCSSVFKDANGKAFDVDDHSGGSYPISFPYFPE